MVTLIVWASIIAYLVLGFVISRKIFVEELGNSYRTYLARNGEPYWTHEYTSAFWWSLLSIPLWAITIPLHRVLAETDFEKADRQATELKIAQEELKRLEKEFDFDTRFESLHERIDQLRTKW